MQNQELFFAVTVVILKRAQSAPQDCIPTRLKGFLHPISRTPADNITLIHLCFLLQEKKPCKSQGFYFNNFITSFRAFHQASGDQILFLPVFQTLPPLSLIRRRLCWRLLVMPSLRLSQGL